MLWLEGNGGEGRGKEGFFFILSFVQILGGKENGGRQKPLITHFLSPLQKWRIFRENHLFDKNALPRVWKHKIIF